VPWAQLDSATRVPRRIGRRVSRVTQLSPGLAFGVHNNNLTNLTRGVVERVFAVESGGKLIPVPKPAPGRVASELAGVAAELDSHTSSTTPYTYDEFVGTYEGRRRMVYSAAVDSLAARPVHRGDASSRAFLKAEKVAFYAKADPAPRLIHPRDPRYNVEVGRYIKKIEHLVYHSIDELWGQRTVLKGYNAQSVAGILRRKWDSFHKPVAIGLDASRFDQHVSVDALKWEHSRYVAWFNGPDRERLEELLSWQLDTKVTAVADDGRLKYRVRGMRFSGDMNTGLGNCLLMSSMVYAWCRKQGVKAQLANNGDDCVLVLDTAQLRLLDIGGMTRWFATLGFTMKMEEPVRDFERIQFCQAHPVWAGDAWVMVRRHQHAMAKDCISIKPLDHKRVFDAWRYTVGIGGLSLTGGVPVQQEFYAALRRGAAPRVLSDPTMETGFAIMCRGMRREATEPTAASRYSYWLAFGVSPDEQVALEHVYRGVALQWGQPRGEGTTVPTSRTEFLL